MSGDSFELVRLRGGAWGIRSVAYAEICHPGIGPRAEAEALYVRGLDLAARAAVVAARGEEFVIWDIGLGGAANASTVIDCLAGEGVGGRLRLISFDRQLEQLSFAVRHASELGYFGGLEREAGRLVAESRIEFEHRGLVVCWSRELGDFPALLAGSPAGAWPAPHAVLFDPHSPAANPEMWTLPLLAALHSRLDPARPGALATYSRSTAVRTALLLAGFRVGTGGVTATKEDTTVAANDPRLIREPLGARWLERAHRSRAAEPWTTPPYGGRPLTEATAVRLRAHPQFVG